MTPAPAHDSQQRRAVLRTAWLLAAVAVASYAVFLYSAMRPQ
jgi:hypothetical protein